MNVTIEKKDALNGTITVELSANDYLPGIEKKLSEYRRRSNIPGFRAGQAPKSMIEKMYGSSIVFEEVNQAASKALFDFIEDKKLNILGQPLLNEDTAIDSLEKGKDYAFKFDVGISPEFELNVGKDDVFTRIGVEISEDSIDKEVDRLLRRFGKHEEVASIEADDFVYLHLQELNEQGETLEAGVNAESVPMAINLIQNEEILNTFLGKSVDFSFNVNVFALFNNDEAEISHALNIQKLAVSDLNPNFRCTVKKINRTAKAEINQELFDMAFGPNSVSSEEEMRTKLRETLASHYDQQAQHLIEHELIDRLVAKHQLTLPDEFLKRWLLSNHSKTYNSENIDHGYTHEAEYLKNHLFEEKVMTTFGLQIEESDIEKAAIENTRSMFMQYGMMGNISDDILLNIAKDSMKKEESRSRFTNAAIRRKMMDHLLTIVKIDIKMVSEEEFMQIVTDHNQQHHSHQH